jgi:hypothetical protein
VEIAVLENDSDVVAGTIRLQEGPNSGSVSHDNDGVFTYQPDADVAGFDQFAYSAAGPDGLVHTALVFVTITAVNDAPVIRSASDVAVPEDGSRTIDLLALASDVDGDLLNLSALAEPTAGSVEDLGGGLVRYVPRSDFFGSDAFAFQFCDPSGLCAVGTIGVLVSPVNDVLLTVPFALRDLGSPWTAGGSVDSAASAAIVGEVVTTVVTAAALPAAVLTLALIGSLGMGVDPAIAQVLGRFIRR